MNALRRDQPNSSVRGSIEAKQRPVRVTKRIQWSGVVWGSSSSARPTDWNTRKRFIVEADGARIVDDLVELFDQHDAHALQAQIVGDHQADRAGADNRHVG